MGSPCGAVGTDNIKIDNDMNTIEHIVSRYRLYQAQCEKRRLEIDREIEQLTKERASIRPIHRTEGLLRPVLQEIARQTPDIEWEQKEEYHPLGLRGAVLIRGRIKNGSPVFVTFTELGNDLWFDTDSVCSRFAPETLGALNGMNTLSASVKDGTPLLEYIRKQQLKHQQP